MIALAWIPMDNQIQTQNPQLQMDLTQALSPQTPLILTPQLLMDLTLILSPQISLTLNQLPQMESMESVQFHNGKVTAIVTTKTTMLPATGMVVTAVLALIVTLTRMPIAMTAPAWTLHRRKQWKPMSKAKLIVKHKNNTKAPKCIKDERLPLNNLYLAPPYNIIVQQL